MDKRLLVWSTDLVDKERKHFDIKIRLEISEDGTKRFSVSSENGQEKFSPATEWQAKLKYLWDTYHLNDMRPGTELQMELLSNAGLNGAGYEDRCEYLRSVYRDGSKFCEAYTEPDSSEKWEEYFEVDLPAFYCEHNGKVSHYGAAWFMLELPNFGSDKTFEDRIKEIVDGLDCEYEGQEYFDDPGSIDDPMIVEKSEELGIPATKLLAICAKLEVARSDLDDIESHDGVNFEVYGRDWIVATDDEATQEYLERVKNLVDDIGMDGFKDSDPDIEIDGFDGITVTRSINFPSSDRGAWLAGYDGNEIEYDCEGDTYYFYKN